MRRLLVLCALALAVSGTMLWRLAPSSAATTINVPADYSTIQEAINASSDGDTVLVAPGTYFENIDFIGKAVTLSSTSGSATTTIDGRLARRPVVTFASGENSGSVVTGFTLKMGYADFDASYTGGGVSVRGASPVIRGNVIIENSAGSSGGGVGVSQGSPSILENSIRNNSTSFSGSRGGGISVYSTEGDTPSIIGNEIVDNSANSSGGGILVFRAVFPLIQDNLISGNRAERGAGIDYGGGGSIVQNLIVYNRSVFEGAAIDLRGDGPVQDNTIYGNTSLNTTFGSDVHIGMFIGSRRKVIVNNIIVGTVYCTNTIFPPPIAPAEMDFNNVFNPHGAAFFGACSDPTGVNGNISADPSFVNPGLQDFRLSSVSPSINSGTDTLVSLPALDYAANSRVIGAAVDQGAFEFDPAQPTPTSTATPVSPPDLLVESMVIELSTGSSCDYSNALFGLRVTIRNAGGADAVGPFLVDVDGYAQAIANLQAGSSTQIFFNGVTSAGPHVVIVDSYGHVAESNEDNNTLTGLTAIPTFPPTCTPTSTATFSPTATLTPTLTNTATPTHTSTPTNTSTPIPEGPRVEKQPEGNAANADLSVPKANLWICEAGPCAGPGEGALRVVEHAFGVQDGLGAYEFTVEYDNFVIQSVNPCDLVFGPGGAGSTRGPVDELDASAVNTDCAPDPGATNNGTCAYSLVLENLVHFGCVTAGLVPGPTGDFDLASLLLIPHPDLNNDLFPGNDNGVLTVLKDTGCELVDTLGHPVSGSINGGLTPFCRDLAVTVRILEGDLDLDCDVDLTDAQTIAARYGAFFGGLLYSKWLDLEPALHDLDIDIKDIQKVFGRQGSTCQAPVPAQPPLDPPTPFGD